MDQFEAARQKHAKNLERRTRVDAVGTEEPKISIATPIEPDVPKESPDAIIEVKVTLPGNVFSFTLRKGDVAQNANMASLHKQALVNAFTKGLQPLLGTVKET